MVYQLKPDPRNVPTRRPPSLRELEAQKPVKIARDKLPPALGARTRSMALLMSVLGLATFAVPLVNTSIPVLGRSQWSPLMMLEGLIAGNLPAAANLPPENAARFYELLLLDSALFGALFVYGALAVILVYALRKPSRIVIGGAAGLGLVAALLEMHGYADFQLALTGGPPDPAGGVHIVGLSYGLVMFVVMTLLLLIATVKELEGIGA